MFQEQNKFQHMGGGLAAIIDRGLDTKVVTIDPEDPAIIARVKHTMLPGERLMEFYARTGLGKSQAQEMSPEEITRFVAVASQNEDLVNSAAMNQKSVTAVPKFLKV